MKNENLFSFNWKFGLIFYLCSSDPYSNWMVVECIPALWKYSFTYNKFSLFTDTFCSIFKTFLAIIIWWDTGSCPFSGGNISKWQDATTRLGKKNIWNFHLQKILMNLQGCARLLCLSVCAAIVWCLSMSYKVHCLLLHFYYTKISPSH